ncbi:hypothetical protein CYMTET_24195 [Cymbomonas tetramitiformis]|uniref:Uncharacterized protein n=1 Tax=Cymbomonas tetramitiformis TaxID=36881 RepID=A0AAE0FX80_9CHLO|nr:hypothetical protein CYMTET_24195 [Cymbomonas tetramitiformis]
MLISDAATATPLGAPAGPPAVADLVDLLVLIPNAATAAPLGALAGPLADLVICLLVVLPVGLFAALLLALVNLVVPSMGGKSLLSLVVLIMFIVKEGSKV